MRMLYLAWRYSSGRLCPYRTKHNLDEQFRPLDEPLEEEEWRLDGKHTVDRRRPRPPMSHRRLRNVLVAFAKLAEEEATLALGVTAGRI